MRFKDYTGQRIENERGEYLDVICHHGKSKGGTALWECRCKCGNKHIAFGNVIRKRPRCGECGKKHIGTGSITHGQSRTKSYVRWLRLRILGVLCEAWQDRETFAAAVGDLAGKRMMRPDTSQPFGPGNCEIRDKSAYGEFKDLPVSRQRKWQLMQSRAGKCERCAQPSDGRPRCEACRLKQKAKREAKRLCEVCDV